MLTTYLRAALLVAASTVALAACAPRFDPLDLEIIGASSEVPLARAMLVPGIGATPVLNVLESRYSNAYVQELVLETHARRPGQNRFRITFVLPGETGGPGTRDIELKRIDPVLINVELAERFPDIAMGTSAYFVQNRYGPFGFATGRAASGDTCLYAWQTIVRDRQASLFDGPGGRIDLRLELCDADAGEADLLEAMYGFTINAYLSRWNWQPYGDVPVLRPEFGMPGADVRASTLTASVPVPSPASTRTRPSARRQAEPAARTGVLREAGPLALDSFLDRTSPQPDAVSGSAAMPRPTVLPRQTVLPTVLPTDFSDYPAVPPPP